MKKTATARRIKKGYVTRMFAGISPNYDLVNSVTSLFIDHYWRFRAFKALGPASKGLVLDLCAGTLALSLSMLSRATGRVIALDISLEMLLTGLSRHKRRPELKRLAPVCSDGERLPFMNDTFDGVMVAFGIRNLSDLQKGLRELSRVIRNGGRLVILEFSRPGMPLFATLYRFYLSKVLVPIGGALTGDRDAYQYLAHSIYEFYSPEEVASLIGNAGFSKIKTTSLTLGCVTLYQADKMCDGYQDF